MQRAPSSCSPPHGVAANCATLKGRRSNAFSVKFSLVARSGRSLRGPKATLVAGLRDRRLRPARLCEPQKHSTHSSHNFLNFGLSPTPPSGFAAGRQGRRPKGRKSTDHSPPKAVGFVLGAPPLAPLKRRPCRGRRFCESRYSLLAPNPAKSKAQSSPQFSAPCPPHCGSAFAPPRFRAPARFIYIRLAPKELNRFFRHRRAAALKEDTALGPRGPHVPWTGNAYAFPLATFIQPSVSRACAIHLYSAYRRNS